ncbi:MAG: hypothetical protein ACR2JD_04905, partial [Nocardioides sp.]
MNPMNDDERALARALHGVVDPRNDAPLGLEDVQDRANAIRRRRRVAAAAGIAAAAVIIVPTAIIASGGLDRGDDGLDPAATASASISESDSAAPESPTPSDSPSASGSTTPEPAGTAPFDVADLTTGAEPAIEWSDGRDVHRADGSVVAGVLPPLTDGFAPMGSG